VNNEGFFPFFFILVRKFWNFSLVVFRIHSRFSVQISKPTFSRLLRRLLFVFFTSVELRISLLLSSLFFHIKFALDEPNICLKYKSFLNYHFYIINIKLRTLPPPYQSAKSLIVLKKQDIIIFLGDLAHKYEHLGRILVFTHMRTGK